MSRSVAQKAMLEPVRALVRAGPARNVLAFSRLSGSRRAASHLPTLIQPSFWKAMVPKPFRRSTDSNALKRVKSKEWNPATFFIVIFLLIGSMSIQLIALRKSFETFTRQSDVRIGLLREVIEKLQRGEKVDVERMLGTGDAQKEVEWQQVIEEIEKEDVARTQKKKQAEQASISNTETKVELVRKEERPKAPPAQTPSTSRGSFF